MKIRVGDDRHFILIKAFEFLLGVDSQTHCHIQELEHDVADHPDVNDIGQDADALRGELAGIAVEKAGHGPLHTVETVPVGSIGKKPQRENAPGAVEAVDGDSTHRVVDFENSLDKDHGPA